MISVGSDGMFLGPFILPVFVGYECVLPKASNYVITRLPLTLFSKKHVEITAY
jgi:hypothetical protein